MEKKEVADTTTIKYTRDELLKIRDEMQTFPEVAILVYFLHKIKKSGIDVNVKKKKKKKHDDDDILWDDVVSGDYQFEPLNDEESQRKKLFEKFVAENEARKQKTKEEMKLEMGITDELLEDIEKDSKMNDIDELLAKVTESGFDSRTRSKDVTQGRFTSWFEKKDKVQQNQNSQKSQPTDLSDLERSLGIQNNSMQSSSNKLPKNVEFLFNSSPNPQPAHDRSNVQDLASLEAQLFRQQTPNIATHTSPPRHNPIPQTQRVYQNYHPAPMFQHPHQQNLDQRQFNQFQGHSNPNLNYPPQAYMQYPPMQQRMGQDLMSMINPGNSQNSNRPNQDNPVKRSFVPPQLIKRAPQSLTVKSDPDKLGD